MGPVTCIAVYLTIWWTTLFAVLQVAIGQHQCSGQKGKHLYYAMLAETGVFGPSAPPRLKAVMVLGQLSPAELIDRLRIQAHALAQ